MKKSLVLVGVVLGLGSCLLWGVCGLEPNDRAPSSGGPMSEGYWNSSCVTGDGRFLAAGGDHAALIDLGSGKAVERVAGMVKAIGCEQSAAVVAGYEVAFRLPGKTPVAPVPSIGGERLALTAAGGWVWWTRTLSGLRWRGPATLVVTSPAESRRLELLPALFGKVGEARALPTPDTFAVRLAAPLDDGRVVAAVGWQPSQSGEAVEEIPWGFFAIDLGTGEAAPLTMPLRSDPALNQNRVQKIAASTEGAYLAVAAHDGKQLSVGAFAQGAVGPTRVTALASVGAASAVAISGDGALIAVGSEARGPDAPATAWVVDQAGEVIWKTGFAKTIVGLHFLDDRSLVVTSAEAKAVRVALPDGKELWRSP